MGPTLEFAAEQRAAAIDEWWREATEPPPRNKRSYCHRVVIAGVCRAS